MPALFPPDQTNTHSRGPRRNSRSPRGGVLITGGFANHCDWRLASIVQPRGLSIGVRPAVVPKPARASTPYLGPRNPASTGRQTEHAPNRASARPCYFIYQLVDKEGSHPAKISLVRMAESRT
jgi:hypothetical protein